MKNEYEDSWIGLEETAEYLDIKAVTLRNKLKKTRTCLGIALEKCGNLSVLNLMYG